ncbi:MAG: PAS domain S-box protein [Rhodospirillales bacterium]|nr:MAG: PAS domain S-box protein [Rhodospirillales bacterium]
MNEPGHRGSRSLFFLCLIMSVVVVSVGATAIGTLYETAFQNQRTQLADLLSSHVRLLDTVARTEAASDPTAEQLGERVLKRIEQIRAADPDFWPRASGELLVVSAAADDIVVLLRHRTGGAEPLSTALQADKGGVPNGLATAVAGALAGNAGSLVGRDSAGVRVLAAYAPVAVMGWAVVGTVSLEEIRGPFLRAGSVVAGIAIIMIAFGCYLFYAISDPIISRLEEGEARYRELFDSMRSGAMVLEAALRGRHFILKDLNRAGERIDGLNRQDVIGRKIDEILPGVAKEGLLSAIRQVWRRRQPENLPMHVGGEGRAGRWREQYIYYLPNGEVVVLYDDITDQKRAEQVLRDSEARWRSIIEMQSIATMIVDKDNHIRFVNRAAETLFGYSSEKLVGAPFGFPVVEGDVAEIEIIRPNGGVVYAEMQSIPMRWREEQQFLLFIRDISAHRRAEGDLRKLFQAIEQSPVSVIITDVHGKIEYVNPKFTEATGYTYPEVVGKNPSILKSGHTTAEEYALLWQTIGSGNVWTGELLNRKKGGDLFWELASIAPVRDVHGKVTHYVAVKEEITQRKATEERLRQVLKMQAIGELTGGIAHDFNNMLAIILGNLQLLEEEMADDEAKRELITDAIWSAERGAELTSRLLAFARRQRLNPQMTDINMVIREMTDLLRRTLGERIEIREVLSPAVGETMIDRGQLENALLNLTVNARDAMPKGGVLTIATDSVDLGPNDIAEGQPMKPGSYALISVSDTGVGMPRDILDRIFEPFFTTKKFGKGSGLGLSMVYGFVNQSGGHITVDSVVGKGTTMKLFLRRSAPARKGRRHGEPERARRPGGAENVLVVEDDQRVRKTALRVLEKAGYRVVEAANAAEALQKIDQMAQLDLLFTDVVLDDGSSGPELAAEVNRRRPGVRILLTSGYAEDRVVRTDIGGHPVDLLPKPYRRDELARKIREVLDREPPASTI